MRFTWKQATGELYREEIKLGTGFSGAPGHINKAEDESLKHLGPIPRGEYTITLIYPLHAKFGPLTCVLHPKYTNKMFGRAGFLIHGDSIKSPGTGSTGCIILPNAIRRQFRVDDEILVV